MKSHLYIVFVCTLFFSAFQDKQNGQEYPQHLTDEPYPAQDSTPKSIPTEVEAQVGNVHIKINYNSPAVRGREIWGGLVPYDKIWVTGAHNATSISISKAIKVGGVSIPEGKYAFFTIPGREEWALIINKHWEQHQADNYDPGDDIIRVMATPVKDLPLSERLTYSINDLGQGNGSITMKWENLSVSFPFSEN